MGSLPLSSFSPPPPPPPLQENLPSPPGLFFPLKTSARNEKGSVPMFPWRGLRQGLWKVLAPCNGRWGRLLAPPGTEPHAGPLAWPGSSSPHPAVPAHAGLPTAPLCVPTANVGGRAVGLLWAPQPCRGTQVVVGPWATPPSRCSGCWKGGMLPLSQRAFLSGERET